MKNLLRRSPHWLRLLAVLMLALPLAPSAWAGGAQHYPNGVTDFMSGVLPPPGFYWLNYLTYITKDDLRDDDGDKVDGVDPDAGVFAEVPRFVYMSPYKILGATWGAQIFFPLYYADVEVDVDGVGKVVDDDSKGLGDIIFSPLVLAWHYTPNWHAGFAVDIWAPTGNYKDDNVASQILSRNCWTFELVYALSYWQPGGLDVSAKFMYDFNTKNDDPGGGDNEIKYGQEFHFDWGVSYALGKEDYRLGVAGYYYMQTTDDEIDGNEEDSDFRSQVAAIGPAFKWWPGMGKFNVTAKYLKEFGGENILTGQSFWINTVYAF